MTRRSHTWIAALAAALLLLLGVPALAGDPLNLMPEAASAEAEEIDDLIYLVTWIVGITFVGVQGLLVYFLIRYRAKEGVPAKHVHGNHTVELVWTVTPALILVFLALYQADIWFRIKSTTGPQGADPVRFQIFAKQFEWNFRYPGPDGQYGTPDDFATVNQCVVPLGRPAVADMRSMDVLHSFFLPNFRVKQDAVPGLNIPIWFQATKLSADRKPLKNSKKEDVQLAYWDIVCAELCGSEHSKMAAQLYVVTEEEFAKWSARQGCATMDLAPNFDCDASDERSVWSRWDWQTDPKLKNQPPRWKKGFPFYQDDLGEDAVVEGEEEDF